MTVVYDSKLCAQLVEQSREEDARMLAAFRAFGDSHLISTVHGQYGTHAVVRMLERLREGLNQLGACQVRMAELEAANARLLAAQPNWSHVEALAQRDALLHSDVQSRGALRDARDALRDEHERCVELAAEAGDLRAKLAELEHQHGAVMSGLEHWKSIALDEEAKKVRAQEEASRNGQITLENATERDRRMAELQVTRAVLAQLRERIEHRAVHLDHVGPCRACGDRAQDLRDLLAIFPSKE